MILAAGLGTRLRPLTLETPKALVEVGGCPMLEHVARRVVAAGADHLVVNVSPHADQIRAFLRRKNDFGVELDVSEEPDGPLETGGGIRKAAPLFRRDGPILVHNVDVFTDMDLRRLVEAHRKEGAMATLAVREATTDRYLLFDADGLLGYSVGEEERMGREPRGTVGRLDFCGVQVIEPSFLNHLEKEAREKFSTIPVFLRLADGGHRILPHRVDRALWIDIGTHERLDEAERSYTAANQSVTAT